MNQQIKAKHDAAWPSPKTDATISVILAYLSPLIGGLGAYLMITASWQAFPLVVIGLLAWGVSCLGLRRIMQSDNDKRC